MKQYAVGVDLGGTYIKAALVERGRGVVQDVSVATEADQGPEHVIARIAGAILQMRAAVPEDAIAGVGVGAPGVINWARDTLSYPPNIPGWVSVDVKAALTPLLGAEIPVFVENDANVAALGSAHYGAGIPHDHFIMVTLGTGVGGAIIYNDRIFRGATGGAGEIGHMTIDYEGPIDRSGVAGAIEAYLGQRFLSAHAADMLRTRTDSLIHEMSTDPDLDDLTPKMLYDAAVAGDEGAREVLAWAGHKLGCVLGSVINLLDIRKVVVGGGVAAAGDYILGPARRTVLRYVMPGLRDDVEIILETLGNEAGMLGAAHLVFQYLDEHASLPPRSS